MKQICTNIFPILLLAYCQKPAPSSRLIDLNTLVLKQEFQGQSKFHGVTLKFTKDKYDFELGSEGFYWYNSGTYKISGSRIEFIPTVCQDGSQRGAHRVECNQTFNTGYCELTDKLPDIEFAQHLECNSDSLKKIKVPHEFAFPIKGSERKTGEVIELYGQQVTVLGHKPGVIIDTANLREKPTIKSSKQTYFPTDEKNGEFLDAVPKGTKVLLLGKTVLKDKVQKWENHWYLTQIGHNGRAWVFAEFIKETVP